MQTGFIFSEFCWAFAAYAMLVFPAFFLTRKYFSASSFSLQFIAANIWGIALAVYLISIIGHFGFDFFPYALLLCYLVLLVILRKLPGSNSPLILSWKNDYILALMLLVFIVRMIPLMFVDLPHGTDPSFHLVFIQKILNEHVTPTNWLPFEEIPLNYSLGMHSFIALVADFSGVAPHQIFKMGFVLFPALAAGLIATLVEKITDSRSVALWASLSWAFLAFWGGLEFFSWGGLPTLMGSTMFLGLVATLLLSGQNFVFVPAAVILVAVISTHNHSGLSSLLVLMGYCGLSYIASRRMVGLGLNVFWTLACSIPLGAHIIYKYVRDFVTMDGETGLFRFYEGLISIVNVVEATGPYFFALVFPGIFIFVRRMEKESEYFWLSWFALLFSVFVGLEYLYRFVVYWLQGEFYTALTPSRFLTVAGFPAAFFAGLTIDWLLSRIKEKGLRVCAIVMLLTGMGFYSHYILSRHARPVGDVDFEAMQWIRENTSENAFFLNNGKWFPYLAWREGSLTPLPSSERRNAPSVRFKKNNLGRFEEFLARQKDFSRPIYRLEQPEHRLMGRFIEVFRTKETVIYVWR